MTRTLHFILSMASLWIGLILPVAPACAQTVPDGVLAWYRFDPTIFESRGPMFLPIALQIAGGGGFIDPSFHPLFDGILAAGVIGAVPHSVCILDLDVTWDDAADRGFRIETLDAILVLETPADHRTFLDTLATILPHYGSESERSQSLITLRNGQTGARMTVQGWPDWRAIEWASLGPVFVVGVGNGSIDRWLDATNRTDPGDPRAANMLIGRHRAMLNKQDDESKRDDGSVTFLDIWVDLDRLHDRMPDIMAQGRARRWLVAWQLDNARSWMLHGRKRGRFLLGDITWQRRSEERDVVARRSLTLDAWPRDLDYPQPPGDYLAVIPMNFRSAFERIMTAVRSTVGPERLAEYDRSMRRFEVRHRQTTDALWSSFKPYLVISDYPAPPVAIPGATTVYFELASRVTQRQVSRRLETVLQDVIDASTSDPDQLGKTRVVYDRQNRIYALQHDPGGLIRVPSWGWADAHVLVGGWAPSVVTVNRTWIEDARRSERDR